MVLSRVSVVSVEPVAGSVTAVSRKSVVSVTSAVIIEDVVSRVVAVVSTAIVEDKATEEYGLQGPALTPTLRTVAARQREFRDEPS
jgi:hypothetical protein